MMRFKFHLVSLLRYEKMISGMYLGEIVRLVLVKLGSAGHLFGGKVSEDLKTSWKFETRFLTDIEGYTILSLRVLCFLLILSMDSIV